MEERLINHINILFQNMPQDENTAEIKAEFTQNLIDKYHDLVAEGKDPETAFSIAVASIGNINELFPGENTVSEELIAKQKKKSALLISGAVMLYILCVLPVLMVQAVGGSDEMAVGFMFLMIAAATGILIYNHLTKYKPVQNENIVNDFKQWQSGKPSKSIITKRLSAVLWCVIVIAYFLVSFYTGAWYITWLLFIVGVLCDQIMRLCVSMCQKEDPYEKK